MNRITHIHYWPRDHVVLIGRHCLAGEVPSEQWPVHEYWEITASSQQRLKDVLYTMSVKGQTDCILVNIDDGEGWTVWMKYEYYKGKM